MRIERGAIAAAVLVAMAALPAYGRSETTDNSIRAYPDKPMRLVAPFPAGGSSDLVARLVAQKLGDAWGQTVVTDNRPGVGGSLGTAIVAKAPPDGYTMVLGGSAPIAINVHLYKHVGYDPLKDLIPVSPVVTAPTMLVVNNDLPVKTVPQLIALAKAKPGVLTCGSGGIGTPAHLDCMIFQQVVGVKLLHVPYKGTGRAMNDLLGGRIQVVFASMPVSYPLMKLGKVRALAVAAKARTPLAPEIPTFAEQGVPGIVFTSWWGIFVPAHTPMALVDKLSHEIQRVIVEPELKQRFAMLGIEPLVMSQPKFAALVKAEVINFGKVVREAGLKPH